MAWQSGCPRWGAGPWEHRMNYRPYQQILRRKSRQIHVGPVPVGGEAPISVQTMTNTPTTDVAATVAQIQRAEAAGVDIVRVSCPDEDATRAMKAITAAAAVFVSVEMNRQTLPTVTMLSSVLAKLPMSKT